MQKRSTLAKIIVLVMLARIRPAIVSATPVCGPTYCGGCSGSQYDCTSEWIWANLDTAIMLWYSGYSILVCCL